MLTNSPIANSMCLAMSVIYALMYLIVWLSLIIVKVSCYIYYCKYNDIIIFIDRNERSTNSLSTGSVLLQENK